MRRVIVNRAVVEDGWQHIADGEELPQEGDVTVSLARWGQEREALLARGRGALGVRLRGTDDLSGIEGDLGRLAMIALDFPKFTDGRCYSLARLLRERHGFEGQLRATGQVLRDQLFMLARCGFDAFELRQDKDIEGALAAFETFSVRYQAAADQRAPAFRLAR